MKAFSSITSTVIPLYRKDIDTDMIIPAQFLTSTGKGGYGANIFRRFRDKEADFPFNQEKYQDSQILVAGDNFGCGSSREHAVWALLERGIRVIIAPSFADIFQSNSAKNGLVLVALPEDVVQEIVTHAQAENPYQIEVDLKNQSITLADGSIHEFFFDPFRKECILKGLDDFDYLIESMPEIEQWQKKREEQLFYLTTQGQKT